MFDLKKKSLFLVITLLIFTTGIFLIVLQGQTNRELRSFKKINKNSSDIRETFPSVDYFDESYTEDIEGEDEKSEKYDRGFQVLTSEISKNIESLSTISWEKDLTALPIENSDIIVLGKVIDAKARLSYKKKSVYSEFKIEVEDVFKNNSYLEIKDNKYIVFEREGGIVRYPSGYELWHRLAGQQMPIINRTYIFFLTNDFPVYGHYKKDFYLLTAYELTGGQIIPLDNPSNSHPITSFYKGKTDSVLLNDLRRVLRK